MKIDAADRMVDEVADGENFPKQPAVPFSFLSLSLSLSLPLPLHARHEISDKGAATRRGRRKDGGGLNTTAYSFIHGPTDQRELWALHFI